MYYKLNNFTGRLIGSSHVQPYYPIGVSPLNKNDPPKIVFQDASVKPVQQSVSRYSSDSAAGIYSTIKKKQELFQKPDGIPVHLKGGPFDKVLFGVTVALCVVGFLASARTLFIMAFPPKKQ